MKQHNLIVFLTDQQRGDTLGLYGNPSNLTPNLDYYGRRGTYFRKAFTPQPVCGPARSVMQTGKYATQTGCFRNMIPLRLTEETVAKLLAREGYQTGYIGKWHLGDPDSHGPVVEKERGGYQFWLAANLLEFVSDAYDTRLWDNQNQEVRLPGYRVDALTDAAIRFIQEHQHQPFFLFVSFLEPHHQNHLDHYPAPEGYEEKFRDAWVPQDLRALGGSTAQHLSGYYGMVKRIDEAFGRLMDALHSLGLYQKTGVLFTSDHGNQFKTRNEEYKRTPHDSAIHIPMVLCGGRYDSGREVKQLVSLVDVVPTLLETAEIVLPDGLQGRSLLPLMDQRVPDWRDSVFIQISETQIGRAVRTERWMYGVMGTEGDPWKDFASSAYSGTYLYDLKADPFELHNLINYISHQSIEIELQKLLSFHMHQAGEVDFTLLPSPAAKSGYNTLMAEDQYPYFPQEMKKFR